MYSYTKCNQLTDILILSVYNIMIIKTFFFFLKKKFLLPQKLGYSLNNIKILIIIVYRVYNMLLISKVLNSYTICFYFFTFVEKLGLNMIIESFYM